MWIMIWWFFLCLFDLNPITNNSFNNINVIEKNWPTSSISIQIKIVQGVIDSLRFFFIFLSLSLSYFIPPFVKYLILKISNNKEMKKVVIIYGTNVCVWVLNNNNLVSFFLFWLPLSFIFIKKTEWKKIEPSPPPPPLTN